VFIRFYSYFKWLSKYLNQLLVGKKKYILVRHRTNLTSWNYRNFKKSDFADLRLIGQGSFGKVFNGHKEGSDFVIK